jgi:hypothetical protein
MQGFHQEHAGSGLWEAAGFVGRPDENTMYKWFGRLETLESERRATGGPRGFKAVADVLIRKAKQHDRRTGEFLTVDGTAFKTSARLEHCCPDRRTCGSLGRAARHLQVATDKEIVDGRSRAAKRAVPDDPDTEFVDPDALEPAGDDDEFRYFNLGGHRYRIRDTSAGVRVHDHNGKRTFWAGGVAVRVCDLFWGAAVECLAISASENEATAYPEVLTNAVEAIGECPLGASFDSHYSIRPIFRLNTSLAILTACPWRAWGSLTHRDSARA